ncbi:MAG: MFS transporter [Planctomycetaceae bacterium]|nr:MFS transporter [Planctomycetaceae bacterium]
MTKERWYSGITPYQWTVLIVALFGWMLDIFEGQILVANLDKIVPSLVEGASKSQIEQYSNFIFVAFLLGGTIGGVFFGVVSDRLGRKRTMELSILFYTFFAGVSMFSMAMWQLAIFRLIVAIGIAGQWAITSAFVAEVFPQKARAHTGSIFHASGTLGTFLATAVGAYIVGNALVAAWCETSPWITWTHTFFDPTSLPWRLGFAVGLFPAILLYFVLRCLKEPDTWKAAHEKMKADPTKKAGVVGDLFRGECLRSTLVGVSLAGIGLATFWGVHIHGKDIMKLAVERTMVPEEVVQIDNNVENAAPKAQFSQAQKDEVKRWTMFGMFLTTAGLLIGQVYFGPLSQRIGRKQAFVFYHLVAFAIAIPSFLIPFGGHIGQFPLPVWTLYIVLPVFGFFTAGMHAGYAVYFPELFPTRLRGTGTGFCFNTGRLVAALALLALNLLQTIFTVSVAWAILCLLYLLGPVAIWFAKETRGKELTE